MINVHDDKALIELFKQALWEVDRKQVESVDLNAKISELGIDSVATFELIGFLEEQLELQFSDEQVASVQSLGDLAKVIRANA
ncbi:MAG: acyl carrier protein [Myxococcota bacterium]|jgi:acyl carrier protein|nr:acyl carrier protein [Myxococcota bacterium]